MEEGITLLDLPSEIITHILKFLPIRDLLQTSRICHTFRSAAHVVYFHNRLTQIENIDSHHKQDYVKTYGQVNRLLSEYKYILGTWKVVSTCYGGLVHVKFDGYKIVGNRYYTPPNPHTEMPLRTTKLFVVQVNLCGQVQCICYRGFGTPHSSLIEKYETNGFRLRCPDHKLHAHHDGIEVEYTTWLSNELGPQTSSSSLSPLHQRKFLVMSQENSIDCLPLELPRVRENVIIQPGLFNGTYGDHGIELVLLTYDDQGHRATVTKITGDPNVPADKTSAFIDLKNQIYSSETACQSFNLPDNYHKRSYTVPTTCRARYPSKGQIAGTGFTHPLFIDCNWVIFDANTFGQVWTALSSFSIYSRVTQSFS